MTNIFLALPLILVLVLLVLFPAPTIGGIALVFFLGNVFPSFGEKFVIAFMATCYLGFLVAVFVLLLATIWFVTTIL